MAGRKSLQVSTRAPRARLTWDQERFHFLIAQIEKARKTRQERETALGKFRQEHSQKLQPLRASHTAVSRETVLTLDRLLDRGGWSRIEQQSLREILCGTVEALLEANAGDAELKALFDKHSDVDFDTARRAEFQRLKAEAEAMTGLDLGDDESIRSEEDLVQRIYEEMAAREAAADSHEDSRREAKARRRQKSAAQQRSEDSAQQARQSLREIYRKLASAVHPDREADPARRDEKTTLMQKINQAYAANDLLTLFEVQMQLEQFDPEHILAVSAQRLKQYNRLLAEQLATLSAAVTELEERFRMDYGLAPSSPLSAQKLTMLVRNEARQLRSRIEQQQQFLRMLGSKTALKRWLKQQRRVMSDDDFDDDY